MPAVPTTQTVSELIVGVEEVSKKVAERSSSVKAGMGSAVSLLSDKPDAESAKLVTAPRLKLTRTTLGYRAFPRLPCIPPTHGAAY